MKHQRIFRQIFHEFLEEGRRFFHQRELAGRCGLSVGTVSPAIAKIEEIGCIEKTPRGFRLIDPEKLLIYWAARRDLRRDIAYATYVPRRVEQIEEEVRGLGKFTAYTAFKLMMNRSPGAYREVWIYADPDQVKRMFRPALHERPNLMVLNPDGHLMGFEGQTVTPAQAYVDLWQLGPSGSRAAEALKQKLIFSIAGFLSVARESLEHGRREAGY